MRLLEGTATILPLWVRWMFAGLALVFAGLGYWLAGLIAEGGMLAWSGLGLSALFSIGLLAGAVSGRFWRPLWITQLFY
jgi:hypothetical protein